MGYLLTSGAGQQQQPTTTFGHTARSSQATWLEVRACVYLGLRPSGRPHQPGCSSLTSLRSGYVSPPPSLCASLQPVGRRPARSPRRVARYRVGLRPPWGQDGVAPGKARPARTYPLRTATLKYDLNLACLGTFQPLHRLSDVSSWTLDHPSPGGGTTALGAGSDPTR